MTARLEDGARYDAAHGRWFWPDGRPVVDEGAPMTPEQIAAKGAFVRVLREYADRANDNYSGKVAVPEHVLRDAATCIEDQRAHIDTLTGGPR